MPIKVDQAGATAQGDIVGRDKHQHIHLTSPPGVVEQLLQKLQKEVENNEQVRETIEALAFFHKRRPHGGVTGLQAKLDAANRSDEYLDAIEKKELFAKLLERWSLYASAQEIFAYLLGKAEHEFNYVIRPQLGGMTRLQANELVLERIIAPTVLECGSTVFTINHSTAMGMIYWLAEQCFVRWHT